MKNNMGLVIGVGVVALAIGFAAGTMYSKSATSKQAVEVPGSRGNFAPGGQVRAGGFNRGGGNAVIGQVLSKDDKSLTVKLNDGGSKIVFYSDTTLISKATTSTVADVSVGNSVMVNGTTNTDGTVTANTIQLNPRMFMGTTSSPK